MPDKKYWENVLKQVETQKDMAEGAIEQDAVLIEFCKKKVSEFPDDDPKPEGVDEIVEAAK